MNELKKICQINDKRVNYNGYSKISLQMMLVEND